MAAALPTCNPLLGAFTLTRLLAALAYLAGRTCTALHLEALLALLGRPWPALAACDLLAARDTRLIRSASHPVGSNTSPSS